MSTNTPVLLIFFNRPDTLAETFEAIREAKPKKLYLAQDGPREGNENDISKGRLCRDIVNNIDWECEVFTRYLDVNVGCGRGPFQAIDWAFENEDRLIIMEDDCVASRSFFKFCDEMLEKYKADERVFMITGCNMELKTSSVESSYFFGYSGTNWGWATWKRNWVKMDYDCSFTNDEHTKNELYKFLRLISGKKGIKELQSFSDTKERLQKGENISYWDVQWQAVRYLNHQLSIIPSHNLITNIGIGADSTHAKMVHMNEGYYENIGKINFNNNKRYELSFPLIHPKYMIQNVEYDKKIDRELNLPIILRVLRRIKYIAIGMNAKHQ